MAQERKFARGLTRPGVAAQVRETVSQTIRDSACLNKPRLVEPIDYETYIVKNKTILQNDPHREMVLFPHDDVSQTTLPRRLRTLHSTIPDNCKQEVSSLFVKECINTYNSDWNVVHYKYSKYGGDYKQLERCDSPRPASLPQHVFEVDAEAEDREEKSTKEAVALQITKKGWLYKGPDSGQEAGIIAFTKSFKRRYFYLKQQADTTYVLEFHKDDKKLDAKGTIFLDSAVKVAKGSRRGKSAFELHMQDKSVYILGTDNDADLEDWVSTLKKVIQKNESLQRYNSRAGDSPSPRKKVENMRESLEHSMNPELQKYARETDSLLAMRRKEGRQNPFSIYPGMQRDVPDDDCNDDDVDVYRDQFGTRFIVRCEDFTTRLQANVAEDGHSEKLSNPEPFFISMAVYDAREGRKLSEDFHYDPNPPHIRDMVPLDALQAIDKLNSVDGKHRFQPKVKDLDEKWLTFPKQGVFSVSAPHNEIYLVARIEKVLQGGLSAATEPYVRTPDVRLGSKIHRQMKQCCSRIGLYKMPFAWAARPIFKQFSTRELDTYSEFSMYRQESSKISEEELIRHLQDMKKPEKQGKWQSILGTFKVKLYTFKTTLQYTLTPSLVPVRPFDLPPEAPPTFEIQEFSPNKGELVHPHTTYVNNLYVYPRSLKYDTQKSFPKARNIACCIEMRSSDEEGAVPLKCLYGRPGASLFTTTLSAAVLHHDCTPSFNDEIKLVLPVQLLESHHLLFTFYHISCEAPKTSTKASHRKSLNIESMVGYAWLPLLVGGRVCTGERSVPVSVNLPPGYLAYQQLGLGRGQTGPEIKWVDGGKPLFKAKLNIMSTVYTTDQHMHNFFTHCQKLTSVPSPANDMETSNKLKSLHAVDVATMVSFLPTLLNQLLRLLPSTNSEDVANNSVRVLIHIVSAIHEAGKLDILSSYVKYVFVTAKAGPKSIHEELVKALKSVLRPTHGDSLLITKFLRHAWAFFQLITKSMAQHLLTTGRIKMSRNERFPSSYQFHLQTLLQVLTSHITQRHKDAMLETRSANISLAQFIKTCFTYLDRGFVFKLINMYMDSFGLGDPKILHEYKFEFLRIVCNHEHYIALNLPILTRIIKNYRDLKNDYLLSDEFRQKHFLAGMVLHELRMSLNEIHDIRKVAIGLLRNLLAKHASDDRYQAKQKQARIANLYLPLITVVLENCNRLDISDQPSTATTNGDAATPETPTAPSRGSSMVSIETASLGTPRRDPNVLALIAGHSGATSAQNLISEPHMLSHDSDGSIDSSTSSSTPTGNSSGPTTPVARTAEDNDSRRSFSRQHRVSTPTTSHKRAQSLTNNVAAQPSSKSDSFVVRYDKLTIEEVRDLLICFLYVLKNLSEDVLLGWFHNSPQHDIINFLTVLQICLKQFKYVGKKRILQLNVISDSRRAMTLPVKKNQSHHSHIRANSQYGDMAGAEAKNEHNPSPSEADAMFRTMLEANMSSEVALIVLDTLSLYVNHFTDHLHYNEGENPVMQKVLDMYLTFLQTCQSETTQGHAFAALRAFINKFPSVLFMADTAKCGRMCYEILRCCNSRLISTRSEACALMYMLMRTNFEFSRRKSFTRVHLQMIIAVSQLITDVVGLCNARFLDSLSVINNYANSDVAMKHTNFGNEVKDVTKRIREVLMATAKLKEHENNPEMYVDLQYRLAKSYASTPELRKTWLESMAKTHRKHNNFSEAAHCFLHVAALVAEYLRRKGCFPQGCVAFRKISANIEAEENGMRTDESDLQDVQYNEAHLCDILEESCQMLEKAERYEVLLDVYDLIIPIYKYRRDYERLSQVFGTLQQASHKIVDVTNTGRRLLGRYFRVAFYGQTFFEEEHGKEYIYKEPKVTGLTEICDRLKALYSQRFGRNNVKFIDDTNKDIDSNYACILVTFVTPYFDEVELEDRCTDFERNNNLRQFMYETPFTKSGSARGEIDEQYKRRTILTTSHSFPYVTKRISVVYRTEVELTPIEVALDEMQSRVTDLDSVVNSSRKDVKKLQLKLQGSVSVQVNAGPVAYAEAFLASEKVSKYNRQKVAALKQTFRDFVYICNEALICNAHMISSDQVEYQEALTQNFNDMASRLSLIMGEALMENEGRNHNVNHRSSLKVFSVISCSSTSSTA